MPLRPDIDPPSAIFFCEDCGDEFEVDGTIIDTGDGYDFETAINHPSTVQCPNDNGDNIHEISLTDGSTR